MGEALRESKVGGLCVREFESKASLGKEAAAHAWFQIQQAIRKRGKARLLFSAANSQLDMIDSLTALPGIDWNRVEAFHVDEYLGMSATHPASFAGWIRRNLEARVHPRKVHYLAGDAANTAGECARYAALLSSAPIDISFLGFGENGHIGFNDPHVADFSDPFAVKAVSLDERCRLQQVREGHWPSLSTVPTWGITLTCPTLVSASCIICCVPGENKAEAVRSALEVPISTSCPGSVLRTHPNATLFLDSQSASLLSPLTGTHS
jgi:glucosamine-6-phosphate deaminase